MASLIDSIGGGLLSSTYVGMRVSAGEGVRAVKNLLGMGDKPMYQLPYDQSLFGQVYDRALRLLPPSLAYKAKQEMDMQGYKGMKLVQGFLNEAIEDFKGAAAGALQSAATSVLGEKTVNKLGLGKKKSKEGNGGQIPDLHLEWEFDAEYQDPNTGLGGYKVKAAKGKHTFLSSRDTASNEVAALELNNMQKFKPREETLWYIIIDRWEDGDYPTALPKIPTFMPQFADSGFVTHDGSSINYLKWLPAVDYSYRRRNPHNAVTTPYGWGHEFHQISTVTRGMEFSITLEDDRDHSFSKYAKEVINRSASYENASITYWECLIHKITIFILDKQWRVSEKFSLLGLLMSDGANQYQSEIGGKLVFDFQVIGELTDKGLRKLETHVDGSDPSDKLHQNYEWNGDGVSKEVGSDKDSPYSKVKKSIGL